MLLALAVVGLLVLGAVTLRVLPIVFGPALPSGATRLHIVTEAPNLTLGCAAALLAPVTVGVSGDDLVLTTVATGETVNVVWPSGFAAWREGDRAVVVDPWGSVVGREGDVLDSLGGGLGLGDDFHICPFGIVTGR